MFDILYRYLILNRQLSIPGVGVFKVVQVPARLDTANQVIHSPLPIISFSHNAETADKRFFEFASQELKTEQWETIRQFHDFSHQLKNDVLTQKAIELPGIGSLVKNNSGEIIFQAAFVFKEYFPDVSIGKKPGADLSNHVNDNVTTYNLSADEEDVLNDKSAPKNRWWIAALFLGAIGITAIVIYYYTHSAD